MSDFCINNNNDLDNDSFCINNFDFNKSNIIKPPENVKQKFAQKFIFVDSANYPNTMTDNGEIHVKFDEVIKDIVEIELMSVHLPKNASDGMHANIATQIPAPATLTPTSYNYDKDHINYLLLHIENIDLPNYSICKYSNQTDGCFARLPVPGTQSNVFFGRIKNFTNVYEYKPIIQSLDRLNIKITKKDGTAAKDFMIRDDVTNPAISSPGTSIQMTFGITYQTQPDLFDN